jgi:hypothetical protein
MVFWEVNQLLSTNKGDTIMAEIKTKQHEGDVYEFIKSFANSDQKIKDSYELVRLMQEVSGHAPKMWGPSIIGFGVYHYKSDRSKQEGDWPILGFSPRKAAISLYVYSGLPQHDYLLKDLGTFKMGKACIYIKRLSDINQAVLIKMMVATLDYFRNAYGGN